MFFNLVNETFLQQKLNIIKSSYKYLKSISHVVQQIY